MGDAAPALVLRSQRDSCPHAFGFGGAIEVNVHSNRIGRTARKTVPIVERNVTKFGLLERVDMKQLDLALRSKLVRQGITINSVDQAPFIPPLRNYYKEWAEAFGPTEWAMLQSSLGRQLLT